MTRFLTDNGWQWRLLRTIVQGVLGVMVANIDVPGCGIVVVEFEGGSLGPEGWFTKNMKGGKLVGITVFYDTPNPSATGYYEALYRCHWMGPNPAWGKYEHDDDDGGAGNDVDQLDMIELTIAPC